MNENEGMDFDFTQEESTNDTQDASNEKNKDNGNRKKNINIGKFITNKYIRNMLIYAGVCLVVTLLLIVFVRPKKAEVSDTRINTACDDVRLFDDALVLSIGEREELQSKIEEYQDKLKIDIVIATVNLDDSSTIRDYGKDIYVSHKFGWDKPIGDGLILVYETTSDKIELVTYGRLVDLISDKGLKNLSEAIRDNGNTTYFLKSMSFLGELSNSINSRAQSGIAPIALRSLGLAIFVALIPTISLLIAYKRNMGKDLNKAYLSGGANSRIQYNEKRDTLVNSVTTSRKIEKSKSSSNSGGGSRTGGGSL